MLKQVCLGGLAAAALTFGAAGTIPAQAAPLVPLEAVQAGAAAGNVVQVQWRDGRRYYRGGGRWGRGVGPFIGGLAAGAIIGGALADDRRYYDGPVYGYAPSYGYGDDAVARCEARFRSFDRSTGTYTTYGGETRVCPYLR